jgi:hypothetical protein
MEKIYTEKQDVCKLIKSSPEKVQFLLNYSKSLHIVEYGTMQFESNVN